MLQSVGASEMLGTSAHSNIGPRHRLVTGNIQAHGISDHPFNSQSHSRFKLVVSPRLDVNHTDVSSSVLDGRYPLSGSSIPNHVIGYCI